MRPITNPAKLAHLNAQLVAGLRQMSKQMTNKQDFPRSEFRDRLDQLLATGERVGISITEIAGMLEGRAQGLRQRHAVTSPVQSAGVLPKVTRYEGDGNATLVERISLAIRGE
jgi:hypothetical protein